jgi:hypothetical protein
MIGDNEMTNNKYARASELREMIRRAFPAETYDGLITPYDDKLDHPDFDDEKELYEELKGKKWTEVQKELLDSQPDGYVVLTDGAFSAFIAAWLMRSLENIDGENQVRDYVVYAFEPKRDMVPDTTLLVLHRLRALSAPQRDVLHSLLTEFAESDPSQFQRRLALEAVALLESLG